MAALTVIDSSYCNADTTDIGVLRPALPTGENNFLVTDTNHGIIFRVDDTSSVFHKQRTLLDSNGRTIVTFREKGMSMHMRWQAFRGNSTEKKDLIFSAKLSTMKIYSDVDLNVYLATNKEEKICDFRVDSSFVFYMGHSRNNIIAEAKEQMVKVCPNVDMAFIVSLIVLLDVILSERQKNNPQS